MNILFLSLLSFDSITERSIYTDLLREFTKHGHRVYVISPAEKRMGMDTHLIEEENATILRLRIGNTQKTNVIEKGISTVMIEPAFKNAIKRHFADVKFDLVLYSTPPITLVSAIEYVKKRDGARTYLLLKDIFPQNAVDIGMLSTSGIKGLLHGHFRRQERRLYEISDRIGCMSQANLEYLLEHNEDVKSRDIRDKHAGGSGIVEVCPNSIEVIDKSVDEETRLRIRERYNIPTEKKVFIYGGNLGKPQGIPFLIECLRKCRDIKDVFFLIIGDGTEYEILEEYVSSSAQGNLRLMKRLPKEDYDTLVGACDAGMIFLDHRFTIPNFPSRLLSYMQAKMPVLAVTDPSTDIGKVITEGEFGWHCESNDAEAVKARIVKIVDDDLKRKGLNAFDVLNKEYSASKGYEIITRSF